VRRENAALSSGCKSHPVIAPTGSSRSGYGGDEIAEAFGKRVTIYGDRASVQAVMRVNAEQASKCAVERRDHPVGDRPTRQLSLQPVAIGAVVEVTKRLKLSMERVT
jgi:hypothetical protein